uniref:Uncharacterized protein n=1 Tax=Salix viminalis TaxID=40686 RepID=A0A6N2MJN2_SALVM
MQIYFMNHGMLMMSKAAPSQPLLLSGIDASACLLIQRLHFSRLRGLFRVMHLNAPQRCWYLKMNQRKEAMHFLPEHGHLDGAMLIRL